MDKGGMKIELRGRRGRELRVCFWNTPRHDMMKGFWFSLSSDELN